MRKKLPAALSVLLLLLLLSAAAAASGLKLSASGGAGDGRVLLQKNKDGYYLCLPGAWDASAVSLSAEGENWDCVFLGSPKKRVPLNEPADLSPYLGERTPVYAPNGSRVAYVRFLQGSRIASLFFEMSPRDFSAINGSRNRTATEGSLTFLEGDGSVSFSGSFARMNTRGNNTFSYPKKSYEFRLEKKVSLGGIDKGKTWILLANYADVTLLRNQIAMDLALETGLPCSVECAPADVWVNGEYLGLYLLTEKIQIKKNRVSITDLEDKMKEVNSQPLDSYPRFFKRDGILPIMKGYDIPVDPEDITGGYIAVLEKPYRMSKNDLVGVITEDNLCFRIKEPTNPSRAEVEYFADLVYHMLSAVKAADGTDPETGKHFSEFLDLSSFALKYLLDDYTRNYDAAAGSQYMFKDSDSVDPLLYAGPAWDYDLSFGNMPGAAMPANTDFYAFRAGMPYFYARLGRYESFRTLLRQKWRDVFRPVVAVLLGDEPPRKGGALRSFAEYREAIALSAEMNTARRGSNTPASKEAGTNFRSGTAYMEKWIRQRAEYLDRTYALPADP